MKTIKWENPVLVPLTSKAEARGVCSSTGSGDSGDCISNGTAAGNCVGTGVGDASE